MGIGKLIGKLVTAPIKIAVLPIRVIGDVMESPSDNVLKVIEESVEGQIEEIIE